MWKTLASDINEKPFSFSIYENIENLSITLVEHSHLFRFLSVLYLYEVSLSAKFFYTYFLSCCQGMGEPLNNYSALVEAIRVMTGSPFQLSPKRITISTVS